MNQLQEAARAVLLAPDLTPHREAIRSHLKGRGIVCVRVPAGHLLELAYLDDGWSFSVASDQNATADEPLTVLFQRYRDLERGCIEARATFERLFPEDLRERARLALAAVPCCDLHPSSKAVP